MRKKYCRVLSLFIMALCLLAAPFAARADITPAFSDVPPAYSNAAFINYLSSRAIIGGFPDGTYRPGEGLTRAEAAAVLVKAAGLSQGAGPPAYGDVAGHWAAGVINAASAAGLLSGYPDGTFRPDTMITRAEGMAMFLRLSRQPDPGVALPPLADVTEGHWAARPVAIGLAAGMAAGGRNFFPEGGLTRGDMARMLGVLLTRDPGLNRADLKITVKALAGTVSVTPQGGGAVEMKPGDSREVAVGDMVSTGPGGMAEMLMPDGSGLLLEENTGLTVKEARGRSYVTAGGDAGTAVDWLELGMDQGKMFGTLAKYSHNTTGGNAAGGIASAGDLKSLPLVAGLDTWSIRGQLLAVGEETPWWETASSGSVRVQVDMPWGVAGVRGTTWGLAVDSNGGASFSILEGEGELTAGGSTQVIGQRQVVTVPYEGTPGQASNMTPEQLKAFVQETVRQWLQERAQDIQSRSELYLQVQGIPPPNVVSIINQAIQEAVRASQPPTNNNNNNNNNNNTPGTSSPLITSVEWLDGPQNPMNKTIKVGFDGVAKKGSQFDHITLTDWSGQDRPVPVEFDGEGGEQGQYLTVYPPYYLNYGTHYTLKIPAGAVAKLSGNGVNEEKVYSFTTGEWQMSDGPWTMLGHDPQRSGQSQYSGPACPVVKWEEYIESYFYGTPLVDPDGYIYMLDQSGRLSVAEDVYVDGNNYITILDRFSGGRNSNSTPAIGNDGTVYYCAGDTLFAVKAVGYYEDNDYVYELVGLESWPLNVLMKLKDLLSNDLPEEEVLQISQADVSACSPVIGPDGTLYIVAQIYGHGDGYLLAVDPDEPDDHRIKWHRYLGQGQIFSPAVGPDGTVYVAMAAEDDMTGRLFAVNPDGSSRWNDIDGNMDSVTLEYDDYYNPPVAGPVVGPDGTVYVVCGGILNAVTPERQIWSSPPQYGIVYNPPAIGSDGTVYMVSKKESYIGCVYALDPDDGYRYKWLAEREYMDFSTPAIGLNGTVYVVDSMYHSLLALDSQGEEKWLIDIENNYTVAQPVIGAGDTIYLCDEGGNITAVCEGSLSYEVDPQPYEGLHGSYSNPASITMYFNTNIKITEDNDIRDDISFEYIYDDVPKEAVVTVDIPDNDNDPHNILNITVCPQEGEDFWEGVLSIPPGFVTDLSGSVIFGGCTITFFPNW